MTRAQPTNTRANMWVHHLAHDLQGNGCFMEPIKMRYLCQPSVAAAATAAVVVAACEMKPSRTRLVRALKSITKRKPCDPLSEGILFTGNYKHKRKVPREDILVWSDQLAIDNISIESHGR